MMNKYKAKGAWVNTDTLDVITRNEAVSLPKKDNNLTFFSSRAELETYKVLRRYFSKEAIKIHQNVVISNYVRFPFKLTWNIDFWVEEDDRVQLIIETKGLVLEVLKYQLALFAASHPVEWERKFYLVFPRVPTGKGKLMLALKQQNKILTLKGLEKMLEAKFGTDFI